MMFKTIKAYLVLVWLGICTPVFADKYASEQEAETLVKKAVAHIKQDKENAFTDFSSQSPNFTYKDLYVVVYDVQGVVLAHGQNKNMIGKKLISLKDPDGKMFVKERVELAKAKGKFWQNYKFIDPVTKKVLPKKMYCETFGEYIVCAGIYVR